ncbi:aldehyde dehydrogenase 3A2 [Neoconidiobolus thromboides FSU 785]|nr:aldehyde dehydrogenase 3A2 [Neoconidiobolus thromboides FSU 785]
MGATQTQKYPNGVVHTKLLANWRNGKTRPMSYRRQQLLALLSVVKERYSMIIEALVRDFKSRNEAALEVASVIQEITDYLENLDEWAEPEVVKTPIGNAFDTAKILYEPYGLWLNIAPWNFPIVLTLAPLIGAIAAGNACVIKPSELAPNSAAIIKLILEEALDSDCYAVLSGAKEITTTILKFKWDFILYTGNSTVARIVMEAASKHLTPVALELGGKSPVFIDEKTADLRIAARRIVWGKLMNAGQICITVDYCFIHPSIKEKFVKLIQEEITNFYGIETKNNPDYPKIVLSRHVERIAKLLPNQNSPKSHGKIVYGGNYDVEERYFEPTVVVDLDINEAPLMNEEIFGPILPIIEMPNVQSCIDYLKTKDKPLALYIFSDDQKYIDNILNNISSGGVSINDILAHFLVPSLPFGGIGESGMGSYHGIHSFKEFSHKRAMYQSTKYRSLEPLLTLRYPPAQLEQALPLNFTSYLYSNEPTSSFLGKLVNHTMSGVRWVLAAALVNFTGRADGKKFSFDKEPRNE